MSDTPETDAIVRNAATADHPMTRLAATLTVKCEKLERERDEAREDLHNIRINLGEDADGFTLLHAVCALQNERDEARERLAKITKAAEAVIDRWEQPAWKDTEPTGTVIYRLRDALGREAK